GILTRKLITFIICLSFYIISLSCERSSPPSSSSSSSLLDQMSDFSYNPMSKFLANKFNANDDELSYLDKLTKLKQKNRKSTLQYTSPSVVIDDFLFHGDLGHASNLSLLKSLDIRYIINICDCPLDKEIMDEFKVLHINLDDEIGVDIKQHFDQTNQFLFSCKEKNQKVL
ncbi:unnamed protein product, partial [Didymodactylos carnosus]